MSERRINFSDYKSSGVYFIEYDNSIVSIANYQEAARLAVGFNMTGPFNRPVYIENETDVNELFGNINRKLERKGCFTNRNIRSMVAKSPLYVLNLLPVNTKERADNVDTVGFSTLSVDASWGNYNNETIFANMYDRSHFWVADDNAFVNNVFVGSAAAEAKPGNQVKSLINAALFGIGNCGTNDISVLVRKAEGLTGYNVTFLEWYGSKEAIPYKWINPTDYVSDYFFQVIAIRGKWNEDTYKAYSNDVVWKNYFTADGLKKEKLSAFLRLDSVEVVGNWTGCIIPDFTDKQGNFKSLDYLINKSCNKTGLLFGTNTTALDTLCLAADPSTGKYEYFLDLVGDGKIDRDLGEAVSYYQPDFCGMNVKAGEPAHVHDFLSYHINKSKFDETAFLINASRVADSSCAFQIDASTAIDTIRIGDYVRSDKGTMTKIIKKRCIKGTDPSSNVNTIHNIFTTLDNVGFNDVNKVEIHAPFGDMCDVYKFIPAKGLRITNNMLPGYDKDGNVDYEAGVEKIYAMLEDTGIRKGLLNRDLIDYRYIVDTMAYGLGAECGGKVHLAKLAEKKGSCTALINAPSMTQFAESDEPFFGDLYDAETQPRPVFNVKYIPDGGNQDMIYTDVNVESFSLPDQGSYASYTAVFAPFLKYDEGTRTLLVPPAADVSNTFMNKFTGGDPYKAVANTNGVIAGQASGVEYPFDTEDRDYLEPFGINPIILRKGNIMIYGDKTAYQRVNSDLNCLHVRELLNTIEQSCRNVLDDYVFSYNISATRAEVVSRINPILSAMKDSGALVKYEIQCDENNNTKDVINARFCIVDIGVWVSQLMEKIVTRITLNRSTTAED